MEDITLDDQVDDLVAMFPNIPRKIIKTTILSNHGNVESAVSALLAVPERKEGIRDLNAFELQQILAKIDQDQAHTFYSHGLTGAVFVTLSSEEARKYGVELRPFELAALKQNVKEVFTSGLDDEDDLSYGIDCKEESDFDLDECEPGKQQYVYVVCVPTLVREKKSMTSPPVGGIAPGTKLTVKRKDGNRIKITQPLKGWLSVVSKDGVRIVVKMKQTDHDHILAKEIENPESYHDEAFEYDYFEQIPVQEEMFGAPKIEPRFIYEENNTEPKKGFWSRMISNISFEKKTKFDFKGEEEPEMFTESVLAQENYL